MLGNETLLFAETGSFAFVARMAQPRPVADGETLEFHLNLARCHLFDTETETSLAA